MGLPICPHCKSRDVTPDPDNAGRNRCRACGSVEAVRAFHAPASPAALPAAPAAKEEPERSPYWWMNY